MKKQLEMLAKFNEQFQIKEPANYANGLPSKKEQELRIALIQEELNELKQAFADGDTIEVADALSDLAYVLFGTVRAVGMQDVFERLFAEVHKSNMTKANFDISQAVETIEFYYNERGVEAYSSHNDANDTYLVKRASDGKLLKSIYYEPAQIKKILGL